MNERWYQEHKQKEWEQIVAYLHEQGYTHFSIPQLCLEEINMLVRERNRQVRNNDRMQRLQYKKRQW